jgi:membrane-bound metal-dependent hydrolase YbcI (DUF457 family)
MDPLSHLAIGWTLAALRRPDGARGLTAAAVLGALSPDLDAVMMPFGWDRYLRVHEAGTHSLAGAAVCALVTAGAIGLAARATPMRRLWTWAFAGALSHLVLDLVSGAQIRLAWPLPGGRATLPLIAMADPAVIMWSLVCVIALRVARPAGRRVAAPALAVLAVYFVIKAAALGAAFSRYAGEAAIDGEPVLSRVVEARWGTLATWTVADRTRTRLRVWDTNPRGPATLAIDWPLNREPGLAYASRSMSTVNNFLAAHDLAFPVVFPGPGSSQLVLWSDIRYCWNPDAVTAPGPGPIATTADGGARVACGLWFGGRTDASGRPSVEIVRIGDWIQTRAPAR